jgi:Zn-dependent protease with chaperone function
MYFFLLKAIAGSIVGDASAEWFKKTRIGIWFYAKVERLYNWAAKRYDIKIATVEEKLLKKYPNMMNRINMLEQRIATLEEDDGRRNQN